MGKLVLLDAYIEVDGVDLSNHFSQVSIESTKDEADTTGFGSTYREIALGLGDGTISGTVIQDFDPGMTDATLWPLHSAGVEFPVVVRPTSGPVSGSNPEYAMTAVLPSYTPLTGAVGDTSTSDVSFRNASQDGITRTGGDS